MMKETNEEAMEFQYEKVEDVDTLCDGCCFAAGFGLAYTVAIILT